MSELWTTPAFWVLGLMGVGLTGISKSGFAGGAGVVAVPLLALVIPPTQAVVLVLPLLLLMDAQTLTLQRRRLSWPELRMLVPAALFGVVLGGLLLDRISESALQFLLGVLSLLFAIAHLGLPPIRAGRVWGIVLGGVAGITSTLIHAGGPPLNMYLAARSLPRATWIATAAVFFATINLSKVAAYAVIDVWQLPLLGLSAALLPAAMLGVLAGHAIQTRISERVFVRCVMVGLGVSGVLLIVKSL